MPRKRHQLEEIIAKLRQVDVLIGQGNPVVDAVRAIGVVAASAACRAVERRVSRASFVRRRGMQLLHTC